MIWTLDKEHKRQAISKAYGIGQLSWWQYHLALLELYAD